MEQVRPIAARRPQARRREPGWEPTAPQVVLAVVEVVWIVTFGVLVYKRQSHFWSADFDMGLHDQSVWLLAHGRGFLTVRGLQVFGHHATLGYYFFVPFYWLGAGAQFLNLAQVVVVALGAVPIFLLAANGSGASGPRPRSASRSCSTRRCSSSPPSSSTPRSWRSHHCCVRTTARRAVGGAGSPSGASLPCRGRKTSRSPSSFSG